MHRLVAAKLADQPALVDAARARIESWQQSGALPEIYLRGWERWLGLPPTELAEALVDPSEEARALRQNSPFAGALSPRERWDILRAIREVP
jgi:hypothetical protein